MERIREAARSPKPPTAHPTAIPADLDRVVGTSEAARICGFSASHFRAMFKSGAAPAPLRLSARKLGWRLSTLNAWIDQSQTAA